MYHSGNTVRGKQQILISAFGQIIYFLAKDQTPEAEWLPLIVLSIFFFFHLLLLGGVSWAAGRRLILRELLVLRKLLNLVWYEDGLV